VAPVMRNLPALLGQAPQLPLNRLILDHLHRH
jgi:hypothetical protein